MPDTPLVSVIIPVFNGALFLAEALQSVVAQDYSHMEIIVIDDGSTDDSANIVRAFSTIRLFRQENLGPAAARNKGVDCAQGALIAFLDADDIWLPHKTRVQVNHLLTFPQHGYVVCRLRAFTAPGVTFSPVFNKHHWESEPMCSIPSALMVRREVMANIGPFDPQLRSAEDFDWFARAHDCGISAGTLDEVLFEKRLHLANLSLDVALNHHHMFRALEKSIARKRRACSPNNEDV